MTTLEFWFSLVPLLPRLLTVVAVAVLVYVLRHPLGAMFDRVIGAGLTIGKWFSMELVLRAPTAGQQAAADTSMDNRPEDPPHEAHEAAPASSEERAHEPKRTDETLHAASVRGQGGAHRRFDDGGMMSVSVINLLGQSDDNIASAKASLNAVISRALAPMRGNLDEQVVRPLVDAVMNE